METHLSTTPFGRRAASLGQLATRALITRAIDDAAQPGANVPTAINKWHLFRTLTAIRERLGVSDRALAVLNALLSFHPETALTLPKSCQTDPDGGEEAASCELVVFPSNRQLQGRAHGMAETTLRRHLAALVAAGLVLRRDSANGKRYARREEAWQHKHKDAQQDRFSEAFGFDLTPLVVRAAEFEALHEEAMRERRLIQSLKTRITLHRRDISKMITLGLDEHLTGPWEDYRHLFMSLVTPLRRLKSLTEIEKTHTALAALLIEITNALNFHINVQNKNGNDAQNGWHISNSKAEHLQNLEPSSDYVGEYVSAVSEIKGPTEVHQQNDLPLALVLEACPDVKDYHHANGKITSWSGFQRAAEAVRPMIGISPDAWHDACRILTPVGAAIAVAMILQRSEYSSEARIFTASVPGSHSTVVNGSPVIVSAGGYLRALTEKARVGEFTPGPMLMALIGQRMKAKRSAADDRR